MNEDLEAGRMFTLFRTFVNGESTINFKHYYSVFYTDLTDIYWPSQQIFQQMYRYTMR